MGKANKEKNPTDVHRKAERQKELKRNKQQRAQVGIPLSSSFFHTPLCANHDVRSPTSLQPRQMCDRNPLGDAQIKQVTEIKKDPDVALKLIKELEEKERSFGPTERSTQRKKELQMLYNTLIKKQKREQEEEERKQRIEQARAAKEQEAMMKQMADAQVTFSHSKVMLPNTP